MEHCVVPHVSLSRARRLTACQEQDRLHVYEAAGGWQASAPRRARLLHRLKAVTTLDAVLGSGVHDAAAALARAIRDGQRPPDHDALVTVVRARLNDVARWRDVAAWLRAPRATPIYREVLTGEWPDGRVPKAVADELMVRAQSLVRRLLAHPVVGELAHCGRGDVYATDTLDAWYLDVDGEPVKVYAAPDLCYRVGARLELPGLPVPIEPGTICVVDFKTGADRGGLIEQTRSDLCTYALYVRDRLDLPPGRLGYLARCAHLGAANEAEADTAWLLGPADLAVGRRMLARAAADLRARADADGVVRRAVRSLDACRFCAFACLCAEPDRLPPAVAAWLAEAP